MHTVGYKMPCLAGARVPGPQVKPPTPRQTSSAAVPADVPAFICTSQRGIVTCTDEAGSPVQGEQLKQLQALLKPIADAPALADEPVKAKAQSMPAAQIADAKMVAQTPPDSGKPSAPVASQVFASVEEAKAPAPSSAKIPAPSTASIKSVSDPPAPPAPVSEPPAAIPTSKPDMPARAAPKKTNPPITLATPDLSAKSPGSDVRAFAVSSRGNDESVSFSAPAPPPPAPPAPVARSSTSSLIPGNSSAEPSSSTPAAPAPKAVSRPSGGFPGNVDPADFLPVEDFGTPTVTVASARSADANSGGETKKLDIVNEKGLIPGNLQLELGEIVNLLQAVNAEPIKYLNYKVYPGNVPPDAPQGTAASTVLEFSPGNVAPKGGDMKAVKMELAPGNIPPDLGDVLEFLKGNES